MPRFKVYFGLVIAVLVSTNFQLNAGQSTISSDPFSIGYGRVSSTFGSEWNTSETDSANTSTIQGDFTFTPTLGQTSGSGNFSSGGPTFLNRELDSFNSGHSGTAHTFTVDVDGSVSSGALPAGKSGPRTRLEITSIQIWGVDSRFCTACGPGRVPLDETGPIRWAEVTTGNTGTSPFQEFPTCASVAPDCDTFGVLGAATHFGQLVWDPPDPNMGAAGFVADTRTFNIELGPAAKIDRIGVDGFEIFGIVHLDFSDSAAPCDFDGSGSCGLADINLMSQQGDLVAGIAVSAANQFDLDSDNDIDEDDITEWLSLTGTTNGYNSPMLRGDTDDLNNVYPIDRTVDITDFQLFLAGFTGSCITWGCGNFNGDSKVDITDFSNHFLPNFSATGGGSYGPGQSVPEPSTVLLLGLGGVLLAYTLRCTKTVRSHPSSAGH